MPPTTESRGTGTSPASPPRSHSATLRGCCANHVGNAGQGEAATITKAPTKYYYFGGQRVAMRQPDSTITWLHVDHLGSTSLATDANGDEVSRQSYYPFGQARWSSATPLPTDFQFTGQRNQSTIGLYDYHARFYTPKLGGPSINGTYWSQSERNAQLGSREYRSTSSYAARDLRRHRN